MAARAKPWPRTLSIVLFALVALLMLTALQRQLIYFPVRASSEQLLAQASRLGLEPWVDAEGAHIGWKTPESNVTAFQMLVFHGNAGHALNREYFAAGFTKLDPRFQVFLFEYPGYGAREGKPSEEQFQVAATDAVNLLLKNTARPLFITGESLGSGVASFIASSFGDRIAGLLLVTPFARLADVASHHYPFLPVSLLLTERYDSLEALSNYAGPVAFLLAGRDEVVTTEQGQLLYDSYQGPKWLWIEEDAGHNTLPYRSSARWWQQAGDFLLAPLPAPQP
ncbi:MAG: alpha/beta hydrolase [Pseudomonadota bacterium]